MKDQIFVLRPGFDDRGTTYFCPYSAQVIGFLTYYPQVKDTLEVVEIGFSKPREPLASILDESHQSAPMLVLAEAGEPQSVEGVTIGDVHGRKFVEKTIEILRYLAATRGVPKPH